MRGRALVVALLLTCPTVAAAQGHLSVNWDHCVSAGTLADQTFDCDHPDASYRLVFELQAPSFPGFFAVDLAVDLIETGQPDPIRPFWHYESGGCNSSGLSLSVDPSLLGVGAVGCAKDFTGSGGTMVTGIITAYGVAYGGANRARLLMTVARSAANPITLVEGTDYYLGHLVFSTTNSCSGLEGRCFGCRDQVSITFQSAVLYTVGGGGPYEIQEGVCVTVNGGPAQCAPCPGIFCGPMTPDRDHGSPLTASPENDCSKEVTSVRGRTWGSIKSLYR